MIQSTATAAEVRDRADPGKVLADRVAELYRQLPIAITATFLAACIATYELRAPLFESLLWIWWGIVVIFSAVAIGLIWSYHRSADRQTGAERWLNRIGILAFANGAAWGLAGAVFFPSLSGEEHVFLAFLFAGMTSLGIPIYAVSWRIFAAYAAGIVAPFIFALAQTGKQLYIEVAFLAPVFYAVNVAIAYRLTQVFEAGYRLRHAYGRLTEDYSVLNQRLQGQLVELGEARRQVEASGRKLTLFAERSPIVVIELTPEGSVTQVNHAAEILFGYAADELKGASVKRLVRPEYHADFDRQWAEMVSTRQPATGLRIRTPRRDGIDLVCEWTVTPLVNTEGGLIAVIAQGRDITAQLEADRMKKEFTSTLSHELRTPLTSIIGSLQLVNSGVLGDIDKDVADLTQVAERNGQRLLDLINDILDIEKIESGKLTLAPEAIRIDEMVRESMVLNKGFADRFKVRLELSGADAGHSVNADRKRLLQVMTNLLSNAAKFSPEGGAVEVAISEAGANLRIAVHDRGPGIPESFRSRMFGRFTQADSATTRQKGGTGLGLAICKRLIEMMEGHIGFEDRAGGGSTFWFELPRHKA
ncbi:MAG TPA: ATP-binding protein [Burkholderiales bacterium]